MSTTPEEMTNLFRIYSHVIEQALKIRWNVVIYQADEHKNSSLVSVVNKSQYTHSEDLIGNMQDTLSFLCFELLIASNTQ